MVANVQETLEPIVAPSADELPVEVRKVFKVAYRELFSVDELLAMFGMVGQRSKEMQQVVDALVEAGDIREVYHWYYQATAQLVDRKYVPVPVLTYAEVQDRVAELYSMFAELDTAEGKQWLLDQTLRLVLGEPEYKDFVAAHNDSVAELGMGSPWNTGVKPNGEITDEELA